MVRRLEFIGGASAKFYEVEAVGSSLVIRYGRIGTEGQRLNKEFADPTAALREADKLVGQKTAKGYVACATC